MIQRKTMTARETAEYLGISYWLVTELVKRKQLPCSRVGGRLLFQVESIDEFLKQREIQSLK